MLPTSPMEEIKSGYNAKAALLAPMLLAGATSDVISAAMRARDILNAAWQALGDATSRAAYDAAIGTGHPGEGLRRPHGWGSADADLIYGSGRAARADGHRVVADFLGHNQHESRHVTTVPDIRGLFFKECTLVVGRRGLRFTVIRLTEHPMPVEGLVVAQSPAPHTEAARDSHLTVQVWHPPQPRHD